jgi:acyl-CoA thioester hydrolase
MNHVNHAEFVTYMEVARLKFFEQLLDMDMESPDVVVVSVHVDYQGPLSWGDTVTIELNLEETSEKSFTLSYVIRTDAGTAATAETSQVTIDPESGEARPIPEMYQSTFASLG